MEIRRARPGDGPGIGQVHVASWLTTYQGIVPLDYLDQLDAEKRGAWWESVLQKGGKAIEALWVAVDADGTIVGFASGGPTQTEQPHCTGELYSIYLLQSAQGQGIGRRLVERVATDLWTEGHRTLLVGVLSENPSRLFYERLGAHPLFEETIQRGGKDLVERYYGWSDLSVLLP